MAERIVVWAKTADLQFVGILEYWVNRNKSTSYSKKLIKLVSERTVQISKNPLLYKSTDYKNIRVATLGNFSIFYTFNDSELIIMAFWDNRQDPKKLLEILENKK